MLIALIIAAITNVVNNTVVKCDCSLTDVNYNKNVQKMDVVLIAVCCFDQCCLSFSSSKQTTLTLTTT